MQNNIEKGTVDFQEVVPTIFICFTKQEIFTQQIRICGNIMNLT